MNILFKPRVEATEEIPWVPEDIFFLSILMVGGEVAGGGVRNLISM